MKLCIATCSNLPDWERDDEPFFQALEDAGVAHQLRAWDEPDVDWGQFDACLIRTTWDYMERKDEFVRWAQAVESVTELFNPASVVNWNTDKRYLLDLERAGVEIAPTIWLEKNNPYDLAKLMQSRGWRHGFLKPTVGASARETLRFEPAGYAHAQVFLDRVLARESMMLQPYLQSVETSGELSAVYFDGQFSHSVQKIPVPGDYRVQDDYGATDFAVEMDAALRAKTESTLMVAQRLLGLEKALLYARVDYIQLDSGQHVLNELELVEPSLFFRHSPHGAGRLVAALVKRL